MVSYLERQRAAKLEELRLIGSTKGWTLLTQVYGGHMTKVEFICNKGHNFYISSQSIKRNGCTVCSGNSPIVAASKFYNTVTEKEGYVAPDSYKGSRSYVEITCKYGHKWVTQPSAINHGNWCPECNKVSPKGGATKYYEILKKRGALAADPYVNSKTQVRIQCKEGHIWTTKPATINSDKHWC